MEESVTTDSWLQKLSYWQRSRLSRHTCSLCDMPLDRAGCGAIGEKCSEDVRRERAIACLRAAKKISLRDTSQIDWQEELSPSLGRRKA